MAEDEIGERSGPGDSSWASTERSAHLDRLLAPTGAKALVVVAESSHDPRMAPFVGPGRLGAGLVVWPRGGTPHLGYLSPMEREEAARSGLPLIDPERLDIERLMRDGPSNADFLADLLERVFQLSGLAPGTVAITGSQPSGRVYHALRRLGEEGWSFVPGDEVVDELRKRKSSQDLAGIEDAAAGAMAAFRRIARILTEAEREANGALCFGGEPLTVGHLKKEVALVFAERGLEQPHRNIIAPAEEGAVPHNTGTLERVLRAGESLVVDLFPRGRLYADCTRTFCVGEPPPALAAAHAEVLAALEAAEAACRPGVKGWDLQEGACDRLHAAGWPTPVHDPGTLRGYVHGLGHGLGFELHELPSFRRQASEAHGLLEPGDVITLEPGLYEPSQTEGKGWAVRIEDLYQVVEDGVVNLTPLPRALDPSQW